MIDPGTGMLIGTGINAIGSAFGGGAQKANAKEQKREFNMSSAPGVARMLEGSPLREKLLAIMGNIADHGPQRFQPRDMYNPSTSSAVPQLGGRDFSTLQTPAGYKDQSNPIQDMYRELLWQMGYKQFGEPSGQPQNGMGSAGAYPAKPAPSPRPTQPASGIGGRFGVPGLNYGGY